MEALVQAIQGAVVQRISAVETSLIEQSQAIGSLREASLRTDQNLRKMLEGIEKLQEQRAKIPARISNSASSDNGGASSEQDSAGPLPGAAETATASARWRVPLIVSAFLVPFVLLGLLASGVFPRGAKPGLTPAPEISAVPDTGDLQRLRALLSTRPSDESLLLKLGREYVVRKDWTRAEDAYRSVLRSSPRNREALLELSNVLYQQQKYEESVAVLNRLSGGTTRSR
jgi:cytochrome c-type biogenesis protein CcmH/NrfG